MSQEPSPATQTATPATPNGAPDALGAADRAKFAASWRSVGFVEDGMKVGLGTGSTAAWMVKCLGLRVRREGLKIVGVPTSSRTAALAREVGIEVTSLDQAGWLDLTIDGADEFDPAFRLIKGGGGAHLREKIVAAASDRMVVIADPDKDVATLGAFPLPVEVIPFGMDATRRLVERALADLDVDQRRTVFRPAGEGLFVTDEGNHTLDLHLGRIGDPEALSQALNAIPGVVENGLFMDICDAVVIGREDGHVVTRHKQGATEETHLDFAAELALFDA
ncbi:ribose-5-phosphate isomerase RpiA [Pseudooceanicola algae]|uniref:Ribose-5-phosphate isomerase A n=1 Tax=Pseudooceanicola algae TaxID=1537215 RepID=A0A418SCI5_9RHOB|nr:ribose-5-phosphate isomerase RpiA [Pseudooceanicola algae]QPM89023.1 Ribose-5-phosphate isomerase A [Pseudooceanicola algae]